MQTALFVVLAPLVSVAAVDRVPVAAAAWQCTRAARGEIDNLETV
jgi:hypothetical protein